MLLNIKEVALMLRVSPPTVRKMCDLGTLKSVRLSMRALRVPKESVDEYLRAASGGMVTIDSTVPAPAAPVVAPAPVPPPAPSAPPGATLRALEAQREARRAARTRSRARGRRA